MRKLDKMNILILSTAHKMFSASDHSRPRCYDENIRNLTPRGRSNRSRVTSLRSRTSSSTIEIEFNKERIIKRRFINFFIYLLCGCLCLWQVGLSIDSYFNQPVVSNVQPQYINVFLRPSITLCQSEFPIRKIHKVLFEKCNKTGHCLNSDIADVTLSSLDSNIEQFWHMYSVGKTLSYEYVTNACSYAENLTACIKHAENNTQYDYFNVQSYTGVCSVFADRDKFHFFSAKTGTCSLYVKPKTKKDKNGAVVVDKQPLFSELLILINSTARKILSPTQMFRGLRVPYPGRAFVSILTVTELSQISTAEKPCVEKLSEDYYMEELHCINKYVIDYLPCALPFITNHNLTICETIGEIITAVDITQNILTAEISAQCPIKRLCNDVNYKFHVQWTPTATKGLHAEIRFLSNIKFKVMEIYIYGLLELSTDIVGNLGFFLGLSLIGILINGNSFVFKTDSEKKQIDGNQSLQSKYLHATKVVNYIALTICCCLCTWQVVYCLQRYFSYPTVNVVSVERAGTFKFPAVTYCSTQILFTYYLFEVLDKSFQRSNITPKTVYVMTRTPLKAMNLTWERIASIIGLQHENFKADPANCNHALDVQHCGKARTCRNTSLGSPLYVFPNGRCETFHLDVEYTNIDRPIWSFTLLKGFNLIGNWTQFTLLLHNHYISFRHSYYISVNSREFISKFGSAFYDIDVLIVWTRRTIMRNTAENPCVTEAEAEKNYNMCMDRHLERFITCGLLFVNSTLHEPCSTWISYNESMHKAYWWIGRKAMQYCPKQQICDKLSYIYVISPHRGHSSARLSDIKIHFLDDLIETFTEKYSYTESICFTDISNYLGFFLDLSLIGILALIVNNIKNCLTLFNRFFTK